MTEDNPNTFYYTERGVISTKNFETYVIRAQESPNTKLIVKFQDGESAEYTEAHSLQEVFDKMRKLHEIEKKLEIAKKAFNTLKTQINFWHPKGNLAGSSVANYRLDTLREYIERTLTEIEE